MEDGHESNNQYPHLLWAKREISAMCFRGALTVDKYAWRKIPFIAFFFLYKAHSTVSSQVPEEWSPFFCISEQKLNSQEIESLNNYE